MQFKEIKHKNTFEFNFLQMVKDSISEETYWLDDTPEVREFVELVINDFNDMPIEKSNEIIKYRFMIEGNYTFGFGKTFYYDENGKRFEVIK